VISIEYISDGIDRLITLDIRGRGVIYKLYNAARSLVSKPITLKASEEIINNLNPGDFIILTTGFRVLPKEVQETDGPLGIAGLARALKLGFRAKPIILIEDVSKNIMASTLNALNINTVFEDKSLNHDVLIKGFPIDKEKAVSESEEVLDKYSPSIVISLEKAGRNTKGEYHTMKGINVSRLHSKIEYLIESARKRNILTIAVGDGGNEVGMGNIRDTIIKYVPYGDKCQCPCEGGIASESKVDILLTASISNWGGYGIEAVLASLKNDLSILHTPQDEENMLRNAINAGAVDGVTGEKSLSVDGVPLKVHKSLIRILEGFIKK